MTGGKAARWKDEEMADTLTGKAVAFIEQNQDQPFFLYFATHDIHVPRWPNPRFQGTSSCGTRVRRDPGVRRQRRHGAGHARPAEAGRQHAGDRHQRQRRRHGRRLRRASTSRDANGHLCNGPLRGYKGSLCEGGNREPFIARWPGQIKPGPIRRAHLPGGYAGHVLPR